jgi:hypothetical protein
MALLLSQPPDQKHLIGFPKDRREAVFRLVRPAVIERRFLLTVLRETPLLAQPCQRRTYISSGEAEEPARRFCPERRFAATRRCVRS